ncbi:MAG: bifunctional glutamate N-acetyltransferase/amino-acid acetyltransferase ArgJ [Bacteroidales bacterium]|nr:bifunctional glutamate N-acetyltransferase/amino-acid acetyltransferase ArgJ [Bacteroidales bacterium]MCF8386552.1 bifunctional glutamate N-acetyltransferase/amino-acid acetyltransferase ArgJ [Bacteroidales bacterium]MCF8397765.1 bifunctional glutamate N-acetyltransferase/amino-acid acetyltransferase ArgJ [Bacteroidales bacterium]
MIKNLTNVRGIKCWGAHTGVKSLRRDLAIIYSTVPASAAAVFTQNQVVAAPVSLSKKHIKNGKAQAIVINAGNANAANGEQGMRGAEAMAEILAGELKIEKEMVLVSSTGVIGEPFPTEEIVQGIKENAGKLTTKSNAGTFVANAILTTDTFAKEGFVEFDLEGYEVNMAGIAKGSGMIHPNMATMLSFIVTDAAIDPKLLQKTVKEVVDVTFNMITVDGDTSTNDMVAVLANGKAQNDELKTKEDKGYRVFRKNLEDMMMHLAQQIVSDGEGASKFIEYEVVNAKSVKKARTILRSISTSTLVKTAMFGRDPNWGRIISAAGNAGVPFNYEKVDLHLGSESKTAIILKDGVPVDVDKSYLKKLLRESHIHIKLDMKEGKANAKGWGTDLTTDYVMFNSIYTT